MTPMEVMDDASAFLRKVVREYDAKQVKGTYPLTGYAGYPPVRDRSAEKSSYMYAIAAAIEDSDGEELSTVKIEIGFSIYDDKSNGWRRLYNLMEHVRQKLLKHRWFLSRRTALVLPLKRAAADAQPFPQWEGRHGHPTEKVPCGERQGAERRGFEF